MIDSARYPSIAQLTTALLEVWPAHARFLDKSFAPRDAALMDSTERHAAIILKIIDGAAACRRYSADYRFMCDQFVEEEFHFRRNGSYRLSRFEDAVAQVYSNTELMQRYMNFLLLTHVIWENHARADDHFETHYLPALPTGTDHLEVGPGHGLLLHFASVAPAVGSVTGWDVSQTSIDQTRACLQTTGAREVTLKTQDLFDAPEEGRRFGSVALSEVLEHLEDPASALKAVARHMRPGAHLWVNVPINSPAPDHIYLLRTPEEAVDLVRSAGFEPVDTAFFPMTGVSLERARKGDLTISAVVTARLN